MQYESEAKAVHGLGIATLVLSILGIIASLGLIFGAGAVKSIVTEVFEPEHGVVESIIQSDDDLSMLSDGADELIKWFETTNVKDFEAVADSVTVKEMNGFGKVVLTGDTDKIEAALEGIESKYELGIDAKAMAKSLTSLNANGIKVIGETLADLDADDLNSLRSALAAYDLKYVEDFSNLKKSMEDGSGEQLVVDGIVAAIIAVLVWMLVTYVVSLVAAILAMRNCRKPEKLTGAFVWSIVAAALSLFAGHIVTMILLIIMCVYIAKVRKFRPEPADSAGAASMSPVGVPVVQPTGTAPVPPQE